MKPKSNFINVSLFVGLVGAAFLPCPVDAGVRVGNASRSYANAYNQVNAQAEQINQQYANSAAVSAGGADAVSSDANAAVNLPVRVANPVLAEQIARGDTSARVNMANLESCAAIYPNGEFAWGTPTVGMGAGGASTCVAVVEMRAIQMGANGADAVLARANLAAGDVVRCNISDFPESSYLVDAGNVVFPADAEPTMDDVKRVMNNEQKQNAGLKIATGAVVGGLFGNASGKNEVGQEGLFGGGKYKTQNTVVGALSGAALMAGNSYAGKIGGDVILSTGVNAAAGGVVGNIAAAGESVMRIEDCKLPDGTTSSCLWGMLVTKSVPAGKTAYFNISNGTTTMLCNADGTGCVDTELVSVKLEAYGDEDLDQVTEEQFEAIKQDTGKQYHLDGTTMKPGPGGDGGIYAKIKDDSIYTIDRKITAMVSGVRDKAFGWKKSDWRNMKKTLSAQNIYGRGVAGRAYNLPDGTNASLDDFYPMMLDAEDGGIIDLGNKARLKSTLIGAGAGGAMGAFVGYQGAQSDIENRWVTAVREYKDSLQKIYCVTGTRFLGYYNDQIVIPRMGE